MVGARQCPCMNWKPVKKIQARWRIRECYRFSQHMTGNEVVRRWAENLPEKWSLILNRKNCRRYLPPKFNYKETLSNKATEINTILFFSFCAMSQQEFRESSDSGFGESCPVKQTGKILAIFNKSNQ